MRASELDIKALTDKQIEELLYKGIHDDGGLGDCIFVFGSKKAAKNRVPKAVELYKAGRAPKILFTGGNEINEDKVLEAVAMKNKAVELGVPQEDIIIETLSKKNTKENVLASLLVLDRTVGLHRIKRLLVVSTLYHMRRCHQMLKTYMPTWVSFTLCPVYDNTTMRENWQSSEVGRQRACMEAIKIISYIKEGSMEDYEL